MTYHPPLLVLVLVVVVDVDLVVVVAVVETELVPLVLVPLQVKGRGPCAGRLAKGQRGWDRLPGMV
jgi:hypothetical protein